MARLPAHLDAARQELAARFQEVEHRAVDLAVAPWPEVETGVIKLLRGAFQPDRPDHQLVALGLAAAFGDRLVSAERGFWFPHRESPEGVMVGFPEALLMLSPFTAVSDALGKGQLARLDTVATEIRRALAEAKFAPAAGAPVRLGPDDYARLFDPGFLQFVLLDGKRLEELWAARPDKLARDLRDALGRAGPTLPPEARAQFEQQMVGSLTRLDPAQPMGAQVPRVARLAELLVTLFAGTKHSSAAPDEFWEQAVLPLLFTGAPASFPPLEAEEVDAARKGADPLALFLDTVPYQTPAPEDGLLGVFDITAVGLPHPALGPAGVPRFLTVPRGSLEPLLEKLDPAATRAALARFATYLSEQAGQPIQPSAAGRQMEDAAIALLTELKALLKDARPDAQLGLRRLTETEALSDATLAAVGQALQGPRIILA